MGVLGECGAKVAPNHPYFPALAHTSLQGGDPGAPDSVETKSFVERREKRRVERGGEWKERKGGRVWKVGGGGGSPISSQGPGRPARSIASIKP